MTAASLREESEELADLLDEPPPPPEEQAAANDSLLLDLPPGLYEDIHPASYHVRALGFASKHALDKVMKAPAFYKAWVDGAPEEDDDKEAFVIGRALHCAALERDRFFRDYIVCPDFGDRRYKEPKARYKAWKKEQAAGKIELSIPDAKMLDGMVASLHKHPKVREMLRQGLFESTMRWDNSDTGIPCKGRPDWLSAPIAAAADLKGCRDASFDAFMRDSAKWGYYRQDVWYRDGLGEIGIPIEHFVFICVEKTPPYMVAVYQQDVEARALGHEENARTMDTLARCLAANEWPAYPLSIQTVGLPRWKLRSVA